MAIRRSKTLSILSLILWMVFPAWAANAAATEPAQAAPSVSAVVDPPAIDPADDPWLSEQGPAVPVPVEIAEDRVLGEWTNAADTPRSRAAAVRRVRLEFGLGDQLAPAAALLRTPSEDEPELHAELALGLAPGIPAVQMSAARALWKAGNTGAAIHALMAAGLAAMTHVEAQLWLIENVALVVVIVVLGASFFFMLLAALMVFPHAAHDLGDLLSGHTPAFARTAALVALLLVPLVLGEGLVGLALALFVLGFAYGKSRQRSALVMAAVLFIVGLHPMAQLASVTSLLLDRDPALHSFLAVANGIETRADIDLLEEQTSSNVAAAHALAYRARRYGMGEEARQRLDAIAIDHPADAVMLANRGNIEMRQGRTDEAIEYYNRSAALEDSPTVLFDLSQAYAAAFRMEEVESTLARAQAIDADEISALSSLGDAKMVADVGLPLGFIQNSLISSALTNKAKTIVADILAPGRLGDRWLTTAIAFLLAALVSILVANRFDQASVCKRCGHRICTRCEDTVWSDDLCEDCYHLFQNPEDTDASLRMARLQSLSRREVRIDRVWLAASLLIPGAAGFASKRPDLAMFGLLLFWWAAVWFVWPRGIFVDPMLLGSAAWVFFAIPGVLATLAYLGVVFASLAARKNL